jgi:hypothetical protein
MGTLLGNLVINSKQWSLLDAMYLYLYRRYVSDVYAFYDCDEPTPALTGDVIARVLI